MTKRKQRFSEQDYNRIAQSIVKTRIEEVERKIRKGEWDQDRWDDVLEHWWNVIAHLRRVGATIPDTGLTYDGKTVWNAGTQHEAKLARIKKQKAARAEKAAAKAKAKATGFEAWADHDPQPRYDRAALKLEEAR